MTKEPRSLALCSLLLVGVSSSSLAAAQPAAVSASVQAEVPPDRAGPEDERALRAREEKLSEAATLTGGVGLMHTQHAQGGAPGQFRLAFTTELFSSSFLCSPEFPCTDPDDPARTVTRDTADHIGGRLTISVQLARWLDAYLGTSALANSNAANRPSLLQALGDSTLGTKVHGPLSDVFHVGGALELWLVNGTGNVGLDASGTSAKFRGLGTADLRGARKPIPLRFSTNVTYVLDNSGEVVAEVEGRRGMPITRIERFGLNIHRLDHLDVHVGGELFLLNDRIRPLVEYQLLVPINRQGYRCRADNPSSDRCLATDPLVPSSLTVGSRFFPWRRGFNVTAAMDIGISGVGFFLEELRPTPPWMLYVGAGWAFDTHEPPPRVVVERVAEAAPSGQKIRGLVHEEGSNEPVANAIVAWKERPELTSLATGADGRFTTHDLPAGEYAFAIRAEGYEPGECTVRVPGLGDTPPSLPATGSNAAEVALECALQPLPRVGSIVGTVKDLDTGQVVGDAKLLLVDAAGKEVRGAANPEGAFRFERVAPGEARLTVDAEGYLVASEKVDVKVRELREIEVGIKTKPKKSLVSVQNTEIVLRQQIQFALNSAQILPASTGILAEIADVLHKSPRIRRVEVQGHTDASGTPAHNLKLSEERAAAVVAWLTGRGIASERLFAKGYGDTKPLVPNVTNLNRQRNRRVQLMIVEQDTASEQTGPNSASR